MKNSLLIMLFVLVVISCETSVKKGNTEEKVQVPGQVFDSVLAAEYGADDYGMKKYVLAYLKSGPNRSRDSAEAAALQRAHLDNIIRMAEKGSLVLAGPFLDNTETRGIYIFNVETVGEARELTNTDPAIKAGVLEMELHPWYGPAALIDINELNKKFAKKNI